MGTFIYLKQTLNSCNDNFSYKDGDLKFEYPKTITVIINWEEELISPPERDISYFFCSLNNTFLTLDNQVLLIIFFLTLNDKK